MDVIIKRKKPELIRWFRCCGTVVLQYVDSMELITSDEYTKLKHKKDEDERHTELLDTMINKGPLVCGQFLDLLKKKDVNESCPELKEWIDNVNTSGPSSAPGASAPNAAHNRNRRIADNQDFLKRNRSALISKIKNVVNIADDLDLTDEMRAIVQAQSHDEDRMRKVLLYTNSKKAAELLIQALWKYAGDVMEDLTT